MIDLCFFKIYALFHVK